MFDVAAAPFERARPGSPVHGAPLSATPTAVLPARPRSARGGYRRVTTDRRWVVAEPGATYGDASISAPRPGAYAGDEAWARRLQPIGAAVADLSTLDLDEYRSEDLRVVAAQVQDHVDRLIVLRDRIAGTLRRRAVVEAGPGRERAAVQAATRELRDHLGLSPSEAKQASERGRVLQARPQLATATSGDGSATGGGAGGRPDTGARGADGAAGGRPLRPDQIAVIGRIVADVPPEHADRVEAELVAAAATQHATELGRTARRLLAELDAEAANEAEERRHRRRRVSMVQTPDGMTCLSGQLAGLDAEVLRTAVAAFSTPDAPGELARSAEQRTADALVAALRAALDGGQAPADRRVRPHLVVLVPLDAMVDGTRSADGVHATGRDTGDQSDPHHAIGPSGTGDLEAAGDLGGVAELAWSGPIPARQVRRLLTDATVRLLGIEPNGVPIAMSRAVEQPTAALYLALVARDGGCRYPGCDAPATWCDVAHAEARRHDGPLTIDNCLLLCRRHHRKVDLGRWTITIDGIDATFTSPSGRSIRAGPARSRPADSS